MGDYDAGGREPEEQEWHSQAYVDAHIKDLMKRSTVRPDCLH
jgi:hypothetical protein